MADPRRHGSRRRRLAGLVLAVLAAVPAGGCRRHDPARTARGDLALVNARLLASPSAAPLDDAVVVVRDGRITAAGPRSGIALPSGIRTIGAEGRTLTAGFWNAHVHFIADEWREAASAPAADLSARLKRMLLRHGFTTVVDAGSPWPVVSALRGRIDAGDVTGPRILSAGGILFPQGGAPPAGVIEGLGSMPEVHTPAEATALVRGRIEQGADVIKLYLATWWQQPAARLTPAIVSAVTAEASRHGKPVLAHPADLTGIETAIEGGVDVLVHTTAPSGPWPASLVPRLLEAEMALVPTLKLWRAELLRQGVAPEAAGLIQQTAVAQLSAFAGAGGEVLFGTDVGYMQDDDPAEEFALMAEAGMSGRQILAALTTAPAARFAGADRTGVIAPGQIADLVLIDGDPTADPAAFGRVVLVVREGAIVWDGAQP